MLLWKANSTWRTCWAHGLQGVSEKVELIMEGNPAYVEHGRSSRDLLLTMLILTRSKFDGILPCPLHSWRKYHTLRNVCPVAVVVGNGVCSIRADGLDHTREKRMLAWKLGFDPDTNLDPISL